MTKWKKNAKEFDMKVIDDQKGSRYVRLPKPLDEMLGEPDKVKFKVTPSGNITVNSTF